MSNQIDAIEIPDHEKDLPPVNFTYELSDCTETNKIIMRQVVQAIDQGDWAALEAHPGLYETRESVPALHAAFPDMHTTFEQEVVAGEMITTVVTVRATHQHEFLGIPATAKQVSFMVIGLDRIVDGTIVEHWALPDFFSLLQQIGGVIVPGEHAMEWK